MVVMTRKILVNQITKNKGHNLSFTESVHKECWLDLKTRKILNIKCV